ncbi:hypothetical protein [Roseivirga sp.]|uniref:hypothetical protein n=1 Tax=Roseivirga sp. TaxID=1964215 RepID=UPI003B8C421D
MKKRIALLTLTLTLAASIAPSLQGYQATEGEEEGGIVMVSRFKLIVKEKFEKTVNLNVKVDENTNSGSLGLSSSRDVSGVVRYCKSASKRKSCPQKYL